MTLELADRIEALDGPDREIDTEIAVIDGYCLHKNTTRSGAPTDNVFDCDDCGADSWGNRSKNGKDQRLHDPVPSFTTSVDAALTLVPDGWNHGHRYSTKKQTAQAWCEFIPAVPFGPEELLTTHSGKCSSPALAICAAALRARHSNTHEGTD